MPNKYTSSIEDKKNKDPINKTYIGCLYQNSSESIKKISEFSESINIGAAWRIYNLGTHKKLNIRSTVVYIIEGVVLHYKQKA